MEENGVLFAELAEQVGRDFDPFDLVCHVAFDQPPLTRRERADNVRKRNYFAKYGDQARAVLEALLDKYADEADANAWRLILRGVLGKIAVTRFPSMRYEERLAIHESSGFNGKPQASANC